MRYLFFMLFVALFLPNLGIGTRTVYGTVQLADYVIAAYLVVTFWLSLKNKHPQLIDSIAPLMLGFVAWALIGTASIPWRFNYHDSDPTVFSLLKLGKFVLYGVAGVLTAKALRDPWIDERFDWALLAGGCALSAGRFVTGDKYGGPAMGQALEGFQSQDAISVALAIVGCYLVGKYLFGPRRSGWWRYIAPLALLFMVFGAAGAHGRGGIFAGLAGVGYLISRKGVKVKTVCTLVAIATVLITCYAVLPTFHKEVDDTLWPNAAHQARYHALMSFDDGSRFYTWAHEAPKFVNYPFFGTGFYHRGGLSELWETGPHNFFIGVFLETGLVGGILLLGIFWMMWKQANSPDVEDAGCGFALKAALIAAVVGGMGEGYFYGGIALFSLLAVYAYSGSFPVWSAFQTDSVVPTIPAEPARVRVTQYPDLNSGGFAQVPRGARR